MSMLCDVWVKNPSRGQLEREKEKKMFSKTNKKKKIKIKKLKRYRASEACCE